MSKPTLRPASKPAPVRRPTRQEAEEAVRTLIAWAGDDPARPGLENTPARVAEAYGEYFSGYQADAAAELAATFGDDAGYKTMVVLSGIRFESHCEHHIAPFFGHAHIAYIPSGRILGLSKIARIVDIFARRLQTQEALTIEIAQALTKGLESEGVAVLLRAEHHCMSMRSVRKDGAAAVTSHFTGRFESEDTLRRDFFAQISGVSTSHTNGGTLRPTSKD